MSTGWRTASPLALVLTLSSCACAPFGRRHEEPAAVQPRLVAPSSPSPSCPIDSAAPRCNCCRHTTDGVGGCIGSGYPVLDTTAEDCPIPGAAPPHQLPEGGCPTFPGKSSIRIFTPHIGKTAGSSLAFQLARAPINFTYVHTRGWPQFNPQLINVNVDDSFDVLLISTREPLNRTISAFNWRHSDGGGDWNRWWRLDESTPPKVLETQSVEQALYACNKQYPGGFNEFAESLEDESVCGHIGRRCIHGSANSLKPEFTCGFISQGYEQAISTNYYGDVPLDTLIRNGARTFLVRQESYDDDMEALFKWLCIPLDLMPPEESRKHDDEYKRKNDTGVSAHGIASMAKHLSSETYWYEFLETFADNGRSRNLEAH